LFALLVWIFISYFWAEHILVAERQLKQILGTLILCYIYSVVSKNEKSIPYLYITYLILFIGAAIYAKQNIFDTLGRGHAQLDDTKLNANTLAYYMFYLTYAVYELRTFMKRKLLKITTEVLFILMIPLTIVVAILTASRQVLIIQIPLIFILLYLRYIMDTRLRNKVIFILIAIAGLSYGMPRVAEIYDDSYLKTRNELSVKDDTRLVLLKDAFKVGMQHFPFGVGPGNYVYYSPTKNFSHNVYAELFVNEGIVGLILYMWLILLFIFRQYKRFKIFKDKQYLVFLLFGIIYAIDGFFFVFYPYLWLMGVFILVASYSETYYKNRINANVEIKTC
jgi:O-antigen ligase